MASREEQEAAVLRANERFYEAFEQLDIEAMSAVWLHSNRARCIHPGWRTLRGWSAIQRELDRHLQQHGGDQVHASPQSQ